MKEINMGCGTTSGVKAGTKAGAKAGMKAGAKAKTKAGTKAGTKTFSLLKGYFLSPHRLIYNQSNSPWQVKKYQLRFYQISSIIFLTGQITGN